MRYASRNVSLQKKKHTFKIKKKGKKHTDHFMNKKIKCINNTKRTILHFERPMMQ